MFRVQGPSRGAPHVEAIEKPDFTMSREAEGREMAFLWLWIRFPAPLRSCCVALMVGNNGRYHNTPEEALRSHSRSQKQRRSHVLGIQQS